MAPSGLSRGSPATSRKKTSDWQLTPHGALKMLSCLQRAFRCERCSLRRLGGISGVHAEPVHYVSDRRSYCLVCTALYSFLPPDRPRKLLNAQMFNRQYHSYTDIDNVPDRLRWCRRRLRLMQAEAACQIGGQHTGQESEGLHGHLQTSLRDRAVCKISALRMGKNSAVVCRVLYPE